MTVVETERIDRPLGHHSGCEECGFQMYQPVRSFDASTLGFYPDARFPGRCILMLDLRHVDSIEELDAAEAARFMADLSEAVKGIRRATECDRVNIAILGNTVSHLHAHLIPRNVDIEPNPLRPPWEDPRPQSALSTQENRRWMHLLGRSFERGPKAALH